MARAASVADSDGQPIAETGTDNEAGNEETPGSEGEEEYEIEEIIQARKGMFPGVSSATSIVHRDHQSLQGTSGLLGEMEGLLQRA